MNTDEIKTTSLVVIVLRRLARAFLAQLKQYGWIIWMNMMLSVMGYYLTSWQYWATVIPVILLQQISTMQQLKREPKPMTTTPTKTLADSKATQR